MAVPLVRVSAKLCEPVVAADSDTVNAAFSPSATLTAPMLATVTSPATSLSSIVPVASTPPTLNVKLSVSSTTASSVVGTVTVKLVTPAGTVMVPSA